MRAGSRSAKPSPAPPRPCRAAPRPRDRHQAVAIGLAPVLVLPDLRRGDRRRRWPRSRGRAAARASAPRRSARVKAAGMAMARRSAPCPAPRTGRESAGRSRSPGPACRPALDRDDFLTRGIGRDSRQLSPVPDRRRTCGSCHSGRRYGRCVDHEARLAHRPSSRSTASEPIATQIPAPAAASRTAASTGCPLRARHGPPRVRSRSSRPTFRA
jgi:hypothetical protein